jgi:cephalosporin hydroxylase
VAYFYFLFFLLASCLFSTYPEMSEIFSKHNLNKFTDKNTLHSYLVPYTQLLEPFRSRKCAVLEIGVWTGGSALLWHEYLPISRLFLVDVRNNLSPIIIQAMDPDRYSFHLHNAYLPETVHAMHKLSPEGFDIIIDDGDHQLQSQLFLLENYLPLLKKEGLLVIEAVLKNSVNTAEEAS